MMFIHVSPSFQFVILLWFIKEKFMVISKNMNMNISINININNINFHDFAKPL